MNAKEILALGVDIGTTSVSARVLSLSDGRNIHTYQRKNASAVTVEGYPDAFASDAQALLAATLSLVREATEAYPAITVIGLTGQMHGIVCLDEEGNTLSPLYTWQNKFGERTVGGETLCDQIKRKSGTAVPTGFGAVTYYALRELGLLPAGTKKIALIADLVAMRLCGHTAPMTGPTNAASLGFYNIEENCFDREALTRLAIDPSVLPAVTADLAICGTHEGRTVAVPIGDNQASVFGTLRGEDILLNIGTSGQVSFIAPTPTSRGGEVRPYFGGRYLHCGSSLCGGRALSLLSDFLCEVGRALGATVSKSDVYARMDEAARTAKEYLTVSTAFAGTRADASLRGGITGIGVDNFTLPALCAGFCRGIVFELYDLYRTMTDENPTHIVLAGNALRNNRSLRHAAEEIFSCPALLPCHTEEAAFGAALFAAVAAGLMTEEESRTYITYTAHDPTP